MARPKDKGEGPKWLERVNLITEMFPQMASMEFGEVLDDIDVLAQVIKDVINLDSGSRAAIPYEEGIEAYKDLVGVAFSEQPFNRSMQGLVGSDRLETIEAKTGIALNHLEDLLTGDVEPNVRIMELVAQAYNKKPGYFLEYRAMAIGLMIAQRLTDAPHMSAVLYRRYMKDEGRTS